MFVFLLEGFFRFSCNQLLVVQTEYQHFEIAFVLHFKELFMANMVDVEWLEGWLPWLWVQMG